MEPTTLAILAAITLLEGIRRVPRGALVLQRSIVADWRPVFGHADGRLHLLSWWSPLVTSIVIEPRTQAVEQSPGAARTRLTALRPWLTWLRLTGGVVLASIVLGIPAAIGRFGGFGFLASLAFIEALCITTVALAVQGGRRTGKSPRAAIRWAVPFLSPFSAPRAAEALLEESTRGLQPALVAQQLLSPDAFLRWLRPRAYDVVNERPDADARLLAGLDPAVLRHALVTQDAMEAGTTLRCARCGTSFIRGTICPDCGVTLERYEVVTDDHRAAPGGRSLGA